MSIYEIKDEIPSSDYEKLIKFIKNSWRKDHAFVKSKELLDFQHLDKERDVYHFIVAENQNTGEYDALVGYIPLSQYDKSLECNGDYWGAIWKRRDDVLNEEIRGMGFYVWDRLFSLPHFSSHGAISMSNDARQMYKARRLPVDVMSQYYILNEDMDVFHVAGNVQKSHSLITRNTNTSYSIQWIDIEELKNNMINPLYRPYKSIEYFKNRYKKHPIYKYSFLGLYNGSKIQAVMAVREIQVESYKVFRIIDVLGELKGNIYPSIQKILIDKGFEYVDMLNYGINSDVICSMGFSLLNLDAINPIIPNYFEPFVKQNVKFDISYKSKFPYVAFKGDADQDRPNIL